MWERLTSITRSFNKDTWFVQNTGVTADPGSLGARIISYRHSPAGGIEL